MAGEQLTFQVQQTSSRAYAYAYGYEAAHVSTLSVEPAALPGSGLEFRHDGERCAGRCAARHGRLPRSGEDPQAAGFHPTVETVQVSVDDARFSRPLSADVDPATGTWTLDLAAVGKGKHTVFVRALRDRTPSVVVQTAVRGR